LVFLEGLVMEDVGMDIYGHLVYFTTLWYTLWTFGIFCGKFDIYISAFLVCCTKKTLATLMDVHTYVVHSKGGR
jgi:hypothetical protein